MKHYEIILLINPNKSDIIKNKIYEYTEVIKKYKGYIYRLEDIGKLKLSYSIKNLNKAYYILINIKINKKFIDKLKKNFLFNESIIRFLIITIKNPPFGKSYLILDKLNN